MVEISSSLALGETAETAYAGNKGAQNAKDIADIKSGDLPLVSPRIVATSGKSQWSIHYADGTANAAATASAPAGPLTTIYGYKVGFNAVVKWTHTDGYKDPTAMNGGDWGNVALPASDVSSEAVTASDITEDKSFTASIKAPKKGLVLSNGIIKEASSSDIDTKSLTINVHFQYKVVHAKVEAALTAAKLQAMLQASTRGNMHDLQDGRNKVLTGVSTEETQYFVYAYPSKLGELSKITMNDATPLLSDGFTLKKLTVTDPETKATLEYNVYTSVQKGAFTNAKLDIA